MSELVIMKGSEIFTSSLAISEGVGIEHQNVISLIKKYSYLEDLSTFQTGKLSTKGRPVDIYYLTELQSTILITLMKNSEKVINFKVALSKAFFKQQKLLQQILSQQKNAEWIGKRQETKVIRKECTDIIQEFIEYAKAQGSKSANTYYMNFSRMQVTGLFLLEQKYPNARDVMSMKQLNLIEMADEAVCNVIKEEMMANIEDVDS